MKMGFIYLVLCASCLVHSGCASVGFPKGKITVQVIDSAGRPVPDAAAKAYFYEASSFSREYVSDTNGCFVVEGRCDRSIGGGIEKEGYYSSGFGYSWARDDLNALRNRFEPWNPAVTVVLKEIRNPVRVVQWIGRKNIKVPDFDQPFGFDLERGDWVAPYGKGIQSDFVFTANEIPETISSANIQIGFTNEYDGILEYPFDPADRSTFKWPYEAPESGYTNSWSRYVKYYEAIFDYSEFYPGNDYKETVKRREDNLREDKEINYIFRVRSVVDENGQLIKACYGKIKGEIKISADGSIHFTYWFNPGWTISLEDDSDRTVMLD